MFCFCFISHITTSEIKLKQNCFISVLFQFYFTCNHCLTIEICAATAAQYRYGVAYRCTTFGRRKLRTTQLCIHGEIIKHTDRENGENAFAVASARQHRAHVDIATGACLALFVAEFLYLSVTNEPLSDNSVAFQDMFSFFSKLPLPQYSRKWPG